MGLFPRHDKAINDLRAKRAKQEKLVQDLTAPLTELERLRQQEAEAIAAKEAAEAEADQLERERSDLRQDIQLFDTLLADKVAGLRFLNNLVTICERGRLGAAQPAALAHAMGLHAAEHAADLRGRLAWIDARLKELEG